FGGVGVLGRGDVGVDVGGGDRLFFDRRHLLDGGARRAVFRGGVRFRRPDGGNIAAVVNQELFLCRRLGRGGRPVVSGDRPGDLQRRVVFLDLRQLVALDPKVRVRRVRPVVVEVDRIVERRRAHHAPRAR